jgi:hypothetical protein
VVGTVENNIDPGAAYIQIRNDIDACPTIHDIITASAPQGVVAAPTCEIVVAGGANEQVGAAAACEAVVVACANETFNTDQSIVKAVTVIVDFTVVRSAMTPKARSR